MVKITTSVKELEKEINIFIEEYSNIFTIDSDLVRAIITQESRFIAEATSPTGAFGYGQFTGIAAKQVQNISKITVLAADLKDFTKQDANKPDEGIKAICATLWWLFNKKYNTINDKKIQLETVLTFYNAGGIPAALVIKHGGHDKAIEELKTLPKNIRSQSVEYAPQVAQWYIAWHELRKEQKETPIILSDSKNPFDTKEQNLDIRYKALIETLRLLPGQDKSVDVYVNSRDNLTEVTLIFTGEFL